MLQINASGGGGMSPYIYIYIYKTVVRHKINLKGVFLLWDWLWLLRKDISAPDRGSASFEWNCEHALCNKQTQENFHRITFSMTIIIDYKRKL